MTKTIILIGPPGSGKTSCGQALARLLDWSFIDTDRNLEELAGMSIPEIFGSQGESHFRLLERQHLESLVREAATGRFDRYVIGTGGGLPVAPGNFELLAQLGEVVCLMATLDELVARLHGQSGRPLLTGGRQTGDGNERELLSGRLEAILKVRSEHYQRAHYTVDSTGNSAEEVAARIVKLLKICA